MARPREFDPEVALEGVMSVFWEHGYEGASMQHIEAATGLKKQSLYRAFGGKRSMYLEALAAYDRKEIAAKAAAMRADGSVRAKIARLFDSALDAARHGDRRGCFVCNASVDQSPHDPATEQAIIGAIARLERDVAGVLSHAPAYAGDPSAAMRRAKRLIAEHYGLMVLLKAGAPVAKLETLIEDFLADLPDDAGRPAPARPAA